MQVTTFRLDECLDSKALAQSCNAENKCVVERCPVKGQPDEVVLEDVFDRKITLLTVDRTIIRDNAAKMRASNGGIIVIKTKKPRPFMTIPLAKNMIALCKNNIPSWPTIDWSMIYVEIDEEEIYICPLLDADTTKGRPFLIGKADLDAKVTQYIDGIHQRLRSGLLPPASGQTS